GTIINCINYSDLNTSGDGLGGIVYGGYGSVIGCVNYGNLVASSGVGGICGFFGGTWVNNAVTLGYVVGCANYGNISGNNEANGISGSGRGCSYFYGDYNGGTVSADGGEDSMFAITVDSTSAPQIYGCCYTEGLGDYSAVRKNYSYLNERVSFVDGEEVTFADAVAEMNAAIEQYNAKVDVKCNYRYVLNTNPTTSEAYPLILQEVTDAQ
ncbi:MAG: hypothetical protein IJ978_03615, partial [Clostridia bacterium]|nr:hypothetical protein [Clostridia bacterium]